MGSVFEKMPKEAIGLIFWFCIWIFLLVLQTLKVDGAIWKYRQEENSDGDTGIMFDKRNAKNLDSCETKRIALSNLFRIVEEEVERYETCLDDQEDHLGS